MKDSTICECRSCRAMIGEMILTTLDEERRWLGYYTVRVLGELGWVPSRIYRSVFREMMRKGIILESYDPESDDFPRYLAVRSFRRSSTRAPKGGAA